jgi:hypothetical protein
MQARIEQNREADFYAEIAVKVETKMAVALE